MARITNHPILGKLDERELIPFSFDGKEYEGFEGETIAAALLANGIRKLRAHEDSGTARGFYCNIGHCMECRVTVNEQGNVRACLTVIERDMVVESGKHLPNIVRKMVEQQ